MPSCRRPELRGVLQSTIRAAERHPKTAGVGRNVAEARRSGSACRVRVGKAYAYVEQAAQVLWKGIEPARRKTAHTCAYARGRGGGSGVVLGAQCCLRLAREGCQPSRPLAEPSEQKRLSPPLWWRVAAQRTAEL